MDVHRVRFIEHEPKPIHCLAFSDESPSSPRLAVSRGDGSIEIWRTHDGERFYKDLWVPGRTDGSVETLVWCTGRLFTSGLTGIVLEWDLVHLRPSQSQDSCGGAVWCMEPNRERTLLAVGSEDGQVRLFDIASNALSFIRGLNKQEGRVLSLAWHPDGGYIAVGGADSTIRKLDVKNGRCILRITLDEYKSRSTLVWDLKFLRDSTIVSADSLGKVQFWNSSQGTLIQSHSQHTADVLTLAVNQEESVIYSAGIDQKVICLQRMKDEGNKWLKSGFLRAHTHDIRALALSATGLIASGGVDTQLVTCPTSSLDIKSCVHHHPVPDSSKFFSVATGANVLVHQTSMSLKFWQLSAQHRVKSEASVTAALSTLLHNGGRETTAIKRPDEAVSPTSRSDSTVDEVRMSESQPAPLPHCTNGVPKNFLEIKCKGPQHILSSAVSADAANVALSTVDNLWLYRIDHRKLNIKCIKQTTTPCYKMAFTPDGGHVVLASIDDGVKVVDTSTFDIDSARTVQSKHHSNRQHPITNFEISPDSKLVALSSSRKRISICSVESGDVLCKVPRLDGRPTLFTFHQSCDQLVLYAGSEKQLYTFSISDKHLVVVGYVPTDRKWHGRSRLISPNGLVAVPGREGVFVVYDNDCALMVRRSKLSEGSRVNKSSEGADKKSPPEASMGSNESDQGLSRKRKERSFEGTPLHHRYIAAKLLVLYLAPFGQGELVLVERSWTDTLSKLPPALVRNRYGAQ